MKQLTVIEEDNYLKLIGFDANASKLKMEQKLVGAGYSYINMQPQSISKMIMVWWGSADIFVRNSLLTQMEPMQSHLSITWW